MIYVNSADDLIDRVRSSGIISLDYGTYVLEKPLVFGSYVTLLLNGSTLLYHKNAKPEPMLQVTKADQVVIFDGTLIPGTAEAGGTNLDGVQIVDSVGVTLSRLIVAGAKDELVSVAGSEDIEISRCGLVFPLRYSNHDQGEHATGMWIATSQNVRVTENYFAHMRFRAPLVRFSSKVVIRDNYAFNVSSLLETPNPESSTGIDAHSNYWIDGGRNVSLPKHPPINLNGYTMTALGYAKTHAEQVGPTLKPSWWSRVYNPKQGYINSVTELGY